METRRFFKLSVIAIFIATWLIKMTSLNAGDINGFNDYPITKYF